MWDSDSNLLGVGLDDGRIFFYKSNPESNFMQIDEVDLLFKLVMRAETSFK
jgi:hypothetical protein